MRFVGFDDFFEIGDALLEFDGSGAELWFVEAGLAERLGESLVDFVIGQAFGFAGEVAFFGGLR